jgi:hypothetical protein
MENVTFFPPRTVAAMTGLVLALNPTPSYLRQMDHADRINPLSRYANLATPIEGLESPFSGKSMVDAYQPRGRVERTQAIQALFAWIEAQPPVPHLPLDAMDRAELY